MGHLHLVLPALNLIMVQQVSLMMLSLNKVDYPTSFFSVKFFCTLFFLCVWPPSWFLTQSDVVGAGPGGFGTRA